MAGARPATGPTAANATTANASTQAETLDQRFVLALNPEPGEIDVTVRYRIPDDVTSLRVSLSERATVESTEGFHHTGDRTYEWTRSTDHPSVTYTVAANKTVERGREGKQTAGYLYVDTGEWAITPTPQTGLTISGVGQRPAINTTYGFDSPGATGGDIVYLGPHEEKRGEIANQRLRLIVPEAADMRASPAAVFDSVGHAAETLDVGHRDRDVVAIAAPTGEVQYASTGLQRGDSDFWVLDDQGVNTPGNVWIHEYVHTRQVYAPENETRWTVEGLADYYAALLTYRQGRIDYATFRYHLERGNSDRYGDVVLAEPPTWAGTLADYDRGALVMAALDRQIRQATDGGGALQDVVRRINDDGEALSQSRFLSAVETVGGDDSRSFARRYTETNDAPGTWTRREHQRAFSDGAVFEYAFAPPYERRGPYREDAVGGAPDVVTGETLTLPVTVENVGSKAGEFQAVLSADGETVAARSGSLDAGERTTVTFERSFERAGSIRLTVGTAAETVTVSRPAAVTVTKLEAPRRVDPGGTATLRATVAGSASRPADGRVNVTVDGERVASERFTLGAGETATLSADVTFEERGEHTVAAGSRTRTVLVAEEGATTPERTDTAADPRGSATRNGRTPDDGRAGTPTAGQPGFGVPAAVLALLVVARRL